MHPRSYTRTQQGEVSYEMTSYSDIQWFYLYKLIYWSFCLAFIGPLVLVPTSSMQEKFKLISSPLIEWKATWYSVLDMAVEALTSPPAMKPRTAGSALHQWNGTQFSQLSSNSEYVPGFPKWMSDQFLLLWSLRRSTASTSDGLPTYWNVSVFLPPHPQK